MRAEAVEIRPEALASGAPVECGALRWLRDTPSMRELTDALALYSRAGFTEIAAYGEYVASPGTSVCLSKLL